MNNTSAVAVLLILLAGCTSSTSSKTPEGDGTQNGTDGGGETSDGGSGATVTAGEVSFASGAPSNGSSITAGAYTIVAVFDRGSGHLNGSSPCDAPVGNCTFCGGSDGGLTSGNLTIDLLGAGVITVKDGANTLATLPYDADDAGQGDYEIDSNGTPSLSWASGDTLSATATGGAIPAFSASITAPQDIAGLTPSLSLTTSATISTSSTLVVSWTPSSDDGQYVLVLANDTKAGATASCAVAESAGSVSVPASILQQLGTGSGTASLTKTVSKPIAVTGATVSIQAVAPQVVGQVTYGP